MIEQVLRIINLEKEIDYHFLRELINAHFLSYANIIPNNAPDSMNEIFPHLELNRIFSY